MATHRLQILALLFALLTYGDVYSQEQTVTEPQDSETSQTSATEVNLDFLRSGEIPTLEQMRAMEERVREISELVKAATVNIQVNNAQGTGIIVSRDGYILTAAHVIGKPNKTAKITFPDGTTKDAKTLGVNRMVDSGMLKLKGEGTYPYIELGESESLNKGQWIMAVGHPGGWNEARGMVVRVGRIISNSPRVIRTDCTLVGGDSGGPLVDMDGNLIGIHSRIANQLWENLHVPVDTYSEDWDQLEAGEIIGGGNNPYIGISFKDSTNEISVVENESPADEAGLKVGDIILKVNETAISSKTDFGRMARDMKPKDKITIVVKRGDEELELELKVGAQ